MQGKLPERDVVLLGLGHTNAHVLRMWRMEPLPDTRLTCVSNLPVATYSGMLPGVLAGQYPPRRMEIDLVRLCAAAGVRLIVDEVSGLDAPGQQLLFHERAPIPFDVLSIGIGSVPTRAGVEELDGTALAIKPMQTFLERLEDRLRTIGQRRGGAGAPLRITVVGAGAGGVEIVFCLPARVHASLGEVSLEMTLINAQEHLIPGSLPATVRRVERELRARGVRLLRGSRVTRVENGVIELASGETLATDLALWATSAAAPPLLGRLDLPTDDRGFLLTHASLQSTSGAPIFAVGDSGTIADAPTPKAGVYAVRQGKLLWRNIRHLLAHEPPEDYQPQANFLKLLNTGDGRAIGEYKGVSFHSGWAWRLKDAIDGRFMDKYQDYTPMPMQPNGAPSGGQTQMRCAGCGGKVGGSVLGNALRRLEIPPHEHVLLGLDAPDDAAIVRAPAGRPMVVTVDFFAAPLDDPYLVGRLAALNAASDVFALGGHPLAALASATIPVGPTRQQEQLLHDLLAGGLHEFRQMGATLVGGHTIEGPQLTIGFTMLADPGQDQPLTKAGLRVGDRLILTKPLGSGVLLAAHMQARCEAPWMASLLATMLVSNKEAAELARRHGASAVTDITGFGLAGHLLEMLRASGVACELELEAVPLLPGASELLAEGLESTLAPANRTAEAEMHTPEQVRQREQYAALFDPQTCGGLLLGVRADDAEPIRSRLSELSSVPAAVIGKIVPQADHCPRLAVVNRLG